MTDAAAPGEHPLRFLVIGPGLRERSSEVLATVRALACAGHRVTCIQDPRFRDVVEQAGAQFLPGGPPRNEGSHLGMDPCVATARRTFDAAVRASDGIDALIYEDHCYYGKTLADTMGVPAIRLCTGFAPSRAVLGAMTAVNTRRGAQSIYRDGPAARLISWGARRRHLIGSRDILIETLDNLPAVTFVFTTASFQLRRDTLAGGQFRFVGPTVAQRAEREDNQDLISFDGLARPVVHVSLGPLNGPGLRRTARMYRTCIEAFAGDGPTVIVSIGEGGDAARLGALPANVRVHQEVPRLAVLRHADLFVTSGDMRSVNEALYYGVPTIVIPTAEDQPAVAARVTELGLGAMVPSWELSPQIVRLQASALLDDVGVRMLLNRMSRDMRSAGGAGRAAREIAALVRSGQEDALPAGPIRTGHRSTRPERAA